MPSKLWKMVTSLQFAVVRLGRKMTLLMHGRSREQNINIEYEALCQLWQNTCTSLGIASDTVTVEATAALSHRLLKGELQEILHGTQYKRSGAE